MKIKSCICFLFILSMIASLFGRPAPQFIPADLVSHGGCSFEGIVVGQVSSFRVQVPQITFKDQGLNVAQAFNEYRKNCTSSVFKFGK